MNAPLQQRANRGICFNNVIVLGFLSAMLLWTYLGVPLVYLLDGRAYSSVFLRSAYWLVLLVIFFGGCMAFFGVRSFIDWWNGSTSSSLTQGLRGSLRRRVRREIKAHLRDNRTIRRARYSFFQRAARFLIGDRSLPAFLACLSASRSCAGRRRGRVQSSLSAALPRWTAPEMKSLLKGYRELFDRGAGRHSRHRFRRHRHCDLNFAT